jgi:hypothetical protein
LWWSFAADSITSLALAAGYYRFGNWRSMLMIEDERPAAGEPPDTGLGVPRERAGLGAEARSISSREIFPVTISSSG